MRRLFALIVALMLWVSVVPNASAAEVSATLVPCRDSAAFQQRAKNVVPGSSAADRFQKYVDEGLLCGVDDGLPHLVVDGHLDHAGEFIIPGLLFLYLAGWLGWAGRNYLNIVHKSDTPEYKEIQIDVPVAIQCFLGALLWPLQFVKEIISGEIQIADDKIPVSPR